MSVTAGLALGLGLGAIQWLPGLATISSSQRGVDSMALYSSGSLPVRWVLLTLVPDLLGGSGSLGQPGFFGFYNLTEVTSYAGILPLVAAFVLLGRLRGAGTRRSGSSGTSWRWPGSRWRWAAIPRWARCFTTCRCSAISGCREAVGVPAGLGVLTFRYAPPGFGVGLTLSLMAGVLIAGFFVTGLLARRARKPVPRPPVTGQ